ncbi:related to Protein farnesyltransferase/geranylgeranyltransferase type-1 subunit alpha [Saccharomycodes ludwigii]|uniref:Protein farnesyltransferase/geranylgeranyltransferase type-1 subunit alpha n=1 Tax=Saccharomycodes ludwigii TaxID=36035 RepID=A0A376B222_9ASCO|nr:hypothetical protein SCDLUD_003073 [Saccharomycodes ludwigii]KAH3900106.1 hypothetical protein SCDLUD_003073 [Saccharomycodes ludwigii]SSD58717.1 related to Protein farnesyltransferase/geranylgeranyltransferase type-1 subunit alpha [Saccharomycodes ludwigii]
MSIQQEQYTFDDLDLSNVPPIQDNSNHKLDHHHPRELCKILYSKDYLHTLKIFNALLNSNEYSKRSLYITKQVIQLVPAYYTAWNFRFHILQKLMALSDTENEITLDKELDWLDEFTLNNPKNYQIWSYRESLIKDTVSFPNQHSLKRELPIIELMIDDDTKNYHVWSYRKWCVKYYQDYTNEWKFCDKYIDRDVYNNSSWCHRMFILENMILVSTPIDRLSLIEKETKYTMEKIDLAPQNISSWNYYRRLQLLLLNNGTDNHKKNINLQNSIEFANRFNTTSSYALEYLAFAYSALDSQKYRTQILEIYQCLVTKYDPIRANYWKYKISELE